MTGIPFMSGGSFAPNLSNQSGPAVSESGSPVNSITYHGGGVGLPPWPQMLAAAVLISVLIVGWRVVKR